MGLEDQIGKRFILRLWLNKYNEGHPGSSISVTEFAPCQDLMDAFNTASSEV